jgi:hypothetical protein
MMRAFVTDSTPLEICIFARSYTMNELVIETDGPRLATMRVVWVFAPWFPAWSVAFTHIPCAPLEAEVVSQV